MKQFTYKARDKTGKVITGVVESLSEQQAAKSLQERGYLVIFLTERKGFNIRDFFSFGSKVSEREVATFTRLLSTMLATGLPLTDALTNLASQSRPGYFREVLHSVLHDVQSGVSLSESMSRYPAAFSNLYVNLVKAGEASGKVDEALAKLAETLEANLDFKAKVSGAMIYPMVVISAMIAIGTFMITNIIPKVADVYKEFGADLPLPTKILIGLSLFIANYTLLVVAFILLLYLGYRILRRNPTSDYMLNNAFFKLPVFGDLNREVTLAIIMRTLGTLLASGVAILDALKIVAAITGNNFFRTGLQDAAKGVEKGMPLSLILRRNPDFPVMVPQLLAIGEETGTIDQSLGRLAAFYQDSAERKVKTLTTLLEPLMLLLMGGMVGGLAIAVLLPLFNLVNVIR